MRTLFLLVPVGVIHVAVAAVWLYEGLWCKLLRGEPRQAKIVEAVPHYGLHFGAAFLRALGIVEVVIALWVLSRLQPVACAVVQTVLLITLNAGGLRWARHLIHDPPGMVVKNFAFLVLAWVSASFPAWR